MSVIIQEFHSSVFHDVELFKQHYAYSSFGGLQKITDINGVDITLNPILEYHFTYTGGALAQLRDEAEKLIKPKLLSAVFCELNSRYSCLFSH